jgi:60 kDa SS-A/Ro ribonucleoprotein
MQRFNESYSEVQTPQSQPIPGREAEMVKMRSGGYGFSVDEQTMLERFLILGTENGTYYAGEKEMTKVNTDNIRKLVQKDGLAVLRMVRAISLSGRAYKNDPALWVLAMASKIGSPAVRAEAYRLLPEIARIGTHLFHWMEYRKAFPGKGGNGFKRAIHRWYLGRKVSDLCLQIVKYRQRDGWSHTDVLRLGHLKGTPLQQSVLTYAVKGRQKELRDVVCYPEETQLIWAVERAKQVEDAGELVKLILDYRLPHECIDNQWKDQPGVWEALLQGMPPHAMLRNLAKMTSVGLLANGSNSTRKVQAMLANMELLKKSRVHPMAICLALHTYKAGHGLKGKLSWTPVTQIVDALDNGFYRSFGTVEPTGRRILLALDISGSMDGHILGTSISSRAAAAAMALVTLNVERDWEVVGFCSGSGHQTGWGMGTAIKTLTISPRQRLDDVIRYMESLPMGGTDCALPFLWATKQKRPFDAVVTYTDNESWAGEISVTQAIQQYRQKVAGPLVKGAFVAFAANEYSVADPKDPLQMNLVGLDANLPIVLSDFITG